MTDKHCNKLHKVTCPHVPCGEYRSLMFRQYLLHTYWECIHATFLPKYTLISNNPQTNQLAHFWELYVMRMTHKTYSLQRAKLKTPKHKSSILILTLNTHYNNQYTVVIVYKQQHNNHLPHPLLPKWSQCYQLLVISLKTRRH